jgi:hypothetical protein
MSLNRATCYFPLQCVGAGWRSPGRTSTKTWPKGDASVDDGTENPAVVTFELYDIDIFPSVGRQFTKIARLDKLIA